MCVSGVWVLPPHTHTHTPYLYSYTEINNNSIVLAAGSARGTRLPRGQDAPSICLCSQEVGREGCGSGSETKDHPQAHLTPSS